MKKTKTFITIAAACLLIGGCKKEDTPATTTTTASKAFMNINFDYQNEYFSTDGSMTAPVDSTKAKTISNKIDITYYFNNDYSEPGFLDPITRSKHWYWDDYYKPWLSNAVATQYYTTKLTESQFNAAKADQNKIGAYFSDTANVKLIPNDIFPVGSCIGGRNAYAPLDYYLVFGFKNTSSGKRGLILIPYPQGQGWPKYNIGDNTIVNIIREN